MPPFCGGAGPSAPNLIEGLNRFSGAWNNQNLSVNGFFQPVKNLPGVVRFRCLVKRVPNLTAIAKDEGRPDNGVDNVFAVYFIGHLHRAHLVCPFHDQKVFFKPARRSRLDTETKQGSSGRDAGRSDRTKRVKRTFSDQHQQADKEQGGYHESKRVGPVR
jgi:hypothetical protein